MRSYHADVWNDPGFEALPDTALRVRRLRGGAVVLGTALALIVVDVLIRTAFDLRPPVPPVVVPVAIIAVTVAVWWVWTLLSWRAWGWRLDDRTFQTRSGVYRKVWRGVPRDRVQFVEVTSGPLQRSFGLATLVVRTAGVRTPAVPVEDLEADVAERLRAELSPRSLEDATDHPGTGPEP